MNWLDKFNDPGYYPGSSKKRTEPGAPTLDKPISNWAKNPRQYKVKGEVRDFFTTGQLAEALGRKPVTIRKWEQEGVIPKATFKLPGAGGDPRGNRRLYTREQVEGIVAIAREEGLLKGDQRSVRATNFTNRVIEFFRRGYLSKDES